jgi:branched-chain amino acid transport system substrate-binding protein
MFTRCRKALRAFAAAMLVGLLGLSAASAQKPAGDPIKIGAGMPLTGPAAAPGKVIQTALQLWEHDVNAKGGLLGRPVQLIILDDQSSPANVPGLYTKLITIDKVDFVLGPYGTNFVAPAMPTIMAHNKLAISFTALGINRHFNYDKYFSMLSVGQDAVKAFSKGFFELAAAQKPKPQTVAILAADAEFARSCADGAREELKRHGFKVVYDQSYPPATVDFSPMIRAVQASNADIVYIGAYPADTVGIVRAANEVGLTPKMFGGAMIGLLVTPIKVQLGPTLNGIIIGENFTPAAGMNFTGTAEFQKRYTEKAKAAGIDPLGFAWAPFAYGAGQVLAQAVRETKSLDQDKLGKYMHQATFDTVAGKFSFGKNGEWNKSLAVFTQFQNVKPNNLEQFATGKALPVLWPDELKNGKIVYPYAEARTK